MKSQRAQVYKFIEEKYNVKPEYLWAKLPNYAVFRHSDNKKWFGIVMNVPRNKLGLDGKEQVDILGIKCDPMFISFALSERGVLPAYHINKGNWISVLLDGTCPLERVFEMLEESFYLTSKQYHKTTYRDYFVDWIVPANPKYYDIEKDFSESDEILWKQSNNIMVGDTVYLYLAAPISSIMYKCKAIEVNIPYEYSDENLSMTRVMKLKLLDRYKEGEIQMNILREHGVTSVRGPRKMPNSLKYRIEKIHNDENSK